MSQLNETNPNEFSLINQYFKQAFNQTHPDLSLGIGDDCALFKASHNKTLAISKDILNEGVHFFKETPAHEIAHKALAVNLSDLAAMGATPKFFLLGLAMPSNNLDFLQDFSRGLQAIAQQFNCQLIGGDTTYSPTLSISITIIGEVDANKALCRHLGKPDQLIWLSNPIGLARLGLEYLYKNPDLNIEQNQQAQLAQCIAHLKKPTPRIALGQNLVGIASSCIDVSDGLLGDLSHILNASNLYAQLNWQTLQKAAPTIIQQQTQNMQFKLFLTGGDDYELCFLADKTHTDFILTLNKHLNLNCICIGQTIAQAAPLKDNHFLFKKYPRIVLKQTDYFTDLEQRMLNNLQNFTHF